MRPMSLTKREIQGQNSLRDVTDIKKRGRDFLVLLAIGVFLAFINPYGATQSASYPVALAYWTGMLVTGGIGAEICMAAYTYFRPQGPMWGLLAVGAITSALAVTAFIIGIEILSSGPVPFAYWPRIYGLVLVISVAVTIISFLVGMAFDKDESAETERPTDPAQTFLQRLPVKFRTATLHGISSEDHYLRVYTSLGEELILMRLADAVRELSGADGLQVHRSWWIAKAGATEEKRIEGRSILVLPSGIEVPVSRSYRAKAKEAGLIK